MNRTSFQSPFWGAGALLLTLLASCQLGSPTTGGGTEGEGVVGTLVDPAGVPLVGVWVSAYPVMNASLAKGTAVVESVQTDANGVYHFPGLSGGTYNLTATTTKNDTTYALLLRGVLVTEDGADRGADTVKIAGSITFQVRANGQAVVGALCYIAASPWTAVSDETGTCSVTGLPPGALEFSISHSTFSAVLSHFVPVVSGSETEGGLVTEVGGAPPPPVALEPAMTTMAPRSGFLYWMGSSGDLSYHVQLATDSNFTALVFMKDSGITDSLVPYGPLEGETGYFWRVRAVSAGGTGPWSLPKWFITEAEPIVDSTDILILAQPVPNALITTETQIFVWNRLPLALTYQLQVFSDTTAVSSIVHDTTSADTTIMLSLSDMNPGMTYAWRVRRLGSGSTGVWSGFRRFIVSDPSDTTISGATFYLPSNDTGYGDSVTYYPPPVMPDTGYGDSLPYSPPPVLPDTTAMTWPRHKTNIGFAQASLCADLSVVMAAGRQTHRVRRSAAALLTGSYDRHG